VFLQDRLARALSAEKAFEVIVEREVRMKRGFGSDSRKDILVPLSSGLALEDLHRVQGRKMALQGLRVLLLGARLEEVDFLQNVRLGIRGFCRPMRAQGKLQTRLWRSAEQTRFWRCAVRGFVQPPCRRSRNIPVGRVASRFGFDATRVTADSVVDTRPYKQGDCKSFFAFRADSEKSSIPDETQSRRERQIGHCGSVPAARIPRLNSRDQSFNSDSLPQR